MDLLDVAIFGLICFFAYSGWRRGITWVGLSLLGLVVGVIIATWAAPRLARFVSHDPSATSIRSALTVGIFIGIILLIEGAGTAVGFRFRLASLRSRFAYSDSVLGSFAAMLGVLAVSWYMGITFVQSRWTYLDHQIEGSFIVTSLARIAPSPPGFIAQAESAIGGVDGPIPLAGLLPPDLPVVDIPPSADTPGIQAATSRTAKVISTIPDTQSCAGEEAGSGFAIQDDYLVTNAHVVAAGTQFTVITPDGKTHTNVTVVLFDPTVDVAVLHVPHLGMTPLQLLAGDPAPRTTGAVIGYPGGGRETVEPAAVRGTEQASGYTIYNDGQTVTRDIVVVAGKIIPGNSGGPLVNGDGYVIGLVFAESTRDPGQEGYALSVPQIAPDLQNSVTRTAAVSTGGCASG
jgi:S1-C subfamily serine protease/uncharacterized membrane protein required for colicin V production